MYSLLHFAFFYNSYFSLTGGSCYILLITQESSSNARKKSDRSAITFCASHISSNQFLKSHISSSEKVCNCPDYFGGTIITMVGLWLSAMQTIEIVVQPVIP